MKTTWLTVLILLLMGTLTERSDSVYEYELNQINGEKISLEEYRGDVLLIVNTASECGYTPQYAGLQELYETYSDRGFTVLGFPANNFGGQEPGTNEEIARFCEVNYGVTFPMFERVSVKGDDQHPLFERLTSWPNPDYEGAISWNFEKFLIDRNGNLIRRFKSNTTPESEELKTALENAL